MPDITIDTQVLMAGSGVSNISITKSRDLIQKVMAHSELKLAMDEKQYIRREYDKHFRKDPNLLAARMLTQLAKTDRISVLGWDNQQWNSVRHQLRDKYRFHSADYPFVRTASASDDKRLVGEEHCYSNVQCCKFIKRKLGVEVMTAEGACDSIR